MRKIKKEAKLYFLSILFILLISAIFIFLIYGIAELIQSCQ